LERMGTDLLMAVVDARQVTVLRGGKEASVYIPEDMINRLMEDSVTFTAFRMPFVVDSLAAGSPALAAGMQPGDSIIAMNGQSPLAYNDFSKEMQKRREAKSDDHDIILTIMRKGVRQELTLTTDDEYKIGVYPVTATSKLLPVIKKDYGFFASFPAGITLGVNTLKGYVNQLKYVFSKEGAKQLGGFGTIGNIFPATWNWHQFWYMTAFLSIILAFMNILPIPALDGGHVLFLLYELIARRKPSDKFMERAEVVGMALLFGLLIWANLNDVIRFLF